MQLPESFEDELKARGVDPRKFETFLTFNLAAVAELADHAASLYRDNGRNEKLAAALLTQFTGHKSAA